MVTILYGTKVRCVVTQSKIKYNHWQVKLHE